MHIKPRRHPDKSCDSSYRNTAEAYLWRWRAQGLGLYGSDNGMFQFLFEHCESQPIDEHQDNSIYQCGAINLKPQTLNHLNVCKLHVQDYGSHGQATGKELIG